MKNREVKDFVAYEYLSINVSSDKEPLYVDCYENFGWILINNSPLIEKEDYYVNRVNTNTNDKKLINIKFKRDRKVKNKVQLIALQRKVESSLKEIERLEKEPTVKGTVRALTLGVIGTIFLAISVFAITAKEPHYILCALNGIIGLVGWFLGFLGYKSVKAKKEQENISLIDEQYNNLYNWCEQAKKLSD